MNLENLMKATSEWVLHAANQSKSEKQFPRVVYGLRKVLFIAPCQPSFEALTNILVAGGYTHESHGLEVAVTF